jgi:chitin synthase
MANIIDFLKDYRHILKVNPRIKMMYIFYVFITFIASMVGPSTVILMLTDTFYFSFDMNLWLSYVLVLVPVLFYVYVCFKFKNETQIKLAAIISSLFSMVMVAVIVGLISRILNSSFLSPNGLILCSLFIIFIISAILHPSEFKCLFPGLLYFLALPSAFILMNLYSLINLNNVSWGTRENKNKGGEQENKSMSFGSILSKIVSTRDSCSNHGDRKCYRDNLLISLDSLEKRSSGKCYSNKSVDLNSAAEEELLLKHDESKSLDEKKKVFAQKNWIDHECLCEFIEENLEDKEEKFFLGLIEKYLYPIAQQTQNKEEMQQDLTNLRNRCCFNYLILNAFWIILLFTMQLLKNKLEELIYIRISFGSDEIESKYEPVYFMFIMLFLVILFLQFFAMLAHRLITFIQLIRRTRLIERKVNEKQSRNHNEYLNESKEVNMAFECEEEAKNQVIEEAEMEIVIESSDKASSTSTKSTSDSPTMTPLGHQ